MFGRRRHAAQVAPTVTVTPAAAPLPRLAEEQIFELVHARIAAAIGENGEWVVRRRTDDDTDELFRAVLAHQVALEVTSALRDAQLRLDTDAEPAPSASETEAADEPEPSNEPAAPSLAVGPELVDAVAYVGMDEPRSTTTESSAAGRGPSHRHDDPAGDDAAVLDEESLALQWEPAPITTWADLRWPVTEAIAAQLAARELAPRGR